MYTQQVDYAGLGSLFFIVVLSMILLAVSLELFHVRKTKKYRIELSDMYVSAKIKEIATSEGIDLNKEFENFKKWSKKRKMEDSNFRYDDVIEEELKEKVEEKMDKKSKI